MTDTQAKIKEYQARLPHMKEKLAMVAMLFIMSTVMLTSATFAWVVLSKNPEVKGMSTTVAGNGNLEIALVSPDGSEPAASAVGDSNLEVVERNITWGNLVNLSDAAYGLENLVLRPAQLNKAALLSSPLYGADYGKDGRITRLTSNFGFTKWIPPEGNVPGYFGLSSEPGIRAIASTKVEEAKGFMATYLEMYEVTEGKNMEAVGKFIEITENKTWMETLGYVMGVYMQSNMNAGQDDENLTNPTIDTKYLDSLIAMYDAFLEAFALETEALVNLVNLQLFLVNKGDTTQYTPYTVEAFLADTTTEDSLKQLGVQITDLDKFRSDYTQMQEDVVELQTLRNTANTSSIKWLDSGLKALIDNLVYLNNCIVRNKNEGVEYKVSNIGASAALGLNNKSGSEAIITNGVLWEFERRTGSDIMVGEDYYDGSKQGLKIQAKGKRLGITMDGTVYAIITTNADEQGASLFSQDLKYAESLNTGTDELIVVAQDTYGLAMDLWVRTNAAGSYLTLEGNVLTESEMVRATGKDASGNVVELYKVTLTEETEDGESISYEMDLYQVKSNATGDGGSTTETVTWYSAESHRVVTAEELGDAVPIAKMLEVETVIGYEGENRIWVDNALLSTDSTTQGSGSCYVYYADNPEDQARSLELLKAFNVAFVSEDGKLLATATMDTEHHYALNGRVIVPLVLGVDSISLGQDLSGNAQYAITPLEKNVPMRITAIVYLDGTKLSNKEVMAASDIQGQLNIQFGSSEDLNAIRDEKLETAERIVSASVDIAEFDYDTATSDMTTKVKVLVNGDEPDTVTAFFIRAISSTQGTREKTMTFTKDANGEWVADYTFTTPGNYILRTVRLDGVDYDLATAPTVKVKGFAVKSLSCSESTNNHANIMTAANTTTLNLSLQFATNDVTKLPNTVVGRYLREDGTAVNVEFKMDNNQVWKGAATFQSSGEYTLEYLILDGEYMGLDESYHQTAVIYLGMKVAVYTTSPTSFKFLPSEMTDAMKNLSMRVEIMDNTGEEMEALSNAWLYYNMQGSGTRGMSTELKWNGSTGYYEGEFHTEMAGIFNFSNVTVGSNTITAVTTSPTFTILSPQPPEYYAANIVDYQFVPDKTAKMSVQLAYSASATVQANIRNLKTGELYPVIGTLGSTSFETVDGKPINEQLFMIPVVNGEQDGYWQLESLNIWNAYDKNGNLYTQDSPLVMDVTDKGIVTKAVSSVKISFAEDLSKDFGKDANGNVTSLFMEEHTISGLHVDIKDFEGEAIRGINGVTLKYAYGNDSVEYGNYSSSAAEEDVPNFSVILEAGDSDGTHFVQNGVQTVKYAGSYTPTLMYSVNGSNPYIAKNWSGTLPKITVSSVAPSVTISAISPTGTYSVDKTAPLEDSYTQTSASWGRKTTNWTLNASHVSNYTPKVSNDKLTADVYFECIHAAETNWSSTGYGVSGQRYHAYWDGGSNIGNPSVTLNLSKIAGFSSATLDFYSGKTIYSQLYSQIGTEESTLERTRVTKESDAAGYSWTTTGTCKRYIGYSSSSASKRLGGDDTPNAAGSKTPAGTITASTLTVTYEGNTYNFTIPTITINNPY